MKQKEYNLQGFIITVTEGSNITWNQYVSPNSLGLVNFVGHGKIMGDVLLIDAGKTEYDDNDRFKSEEEINEYLENLPKWEKTKYFIKGIEKGVANLEYCEIMKIVEKRKARKILKRIEHKHKKRNKKSLADTINEILDEYHNKRKD